MGFTAARYNTDGSLDLTFNNTGTATTTVGPEGGVAYGVAIQADGKIVLAGTSGRGLLNDFALLRYNSNGTLDHSFNYGGTVITEFGVGDNMVGSVAIQENGKIVIGGSALITTGMDFVTLRYNASGVQDSLWGFGGAQIANFEGNDVGTAMALDGIGRPIVVGSFRGLFGIARFRSDTAADSSVSVSGRVFSPSGRAISGATLTLSSENGFLRHVRTNQLGYYTFASLPVAETFTLNVEYKRYAFIPQTFALNDNLTDFNITALN